MKDHPGSFYLGSESSIQPLTGPARNLMISVAVIAPVFLLLNSCGGCIDFNYGYGDFGTGNVGVYGSLGNGRLGYDHLRGPGSVC